MCYFILFGSSSSMFLFEWYDDDVRRWTGDWGGVVGGVLWTSQTGEDSAKTSLFETHFGGSHRLYVWPTFTWVQLMKPLVGQASMQFAVTGRRAAVS